MQLHSLLHRIKITFITINRRWLHRWNGVILRVNLFSHHLSCRKTKFDSEISAIDLCPKLNMCIVGLWGSGVILILDLTTLSIMLKHDLQTTQPIRSICAIEFGSSHIFVSLGTSSFFSVFFNRQRWRLFIWYPLFKKCINSQKKCHWDSRRKTQTYNNETKRVHFYLFG